MYESVSYGVGMIEADEFGRFFRWALSDIKFLTAVMTEVGGSKKFLQMPLDIRPLADALFVAFLCFHGQRHVFGLRGPLKEGDLGPGGPAMVAYLKELQAMELARLERFAAAKLFANASRRDTVVEDLGFAKNRLKCLADTFL